MGEFNQVLWTLDREIAPHDFERLCIDLLCRDGYWKIVPVGGTKDRGRDAEATALVFITSQSVTGEKRDKLAAEFKGPKH